MSALRQRIDDDVKLAMRQRHKERLGVLRLITAALKQKEIDERIKLNDAQVISIIGKMSKQGLDAMQQFEQAKRADLVEKERFALEILQQYLPTQLSEQEIQVLVAESISIASAKSVKDMGKVMTVLKPKVHGKADMAKVSTVVRQLLS